MRIDDFSQSFYDKMMIPKRNQVQTSKDDSEPDGPDELSEASSSSSVAANSSSSAPVAGSTTDASAGTSSTDTQSRADRLEQLKQGYSQGNPVDVNKLADKLLGTGLFFDQRA